MEECEGVSPPGYVLQVWSRPSPQEFDQRQYGQSNRSLADFERFALVIFKEENQGAGEEETDVSSFFMKILGIPHVRGGGPLLDLALYPWDLYSPRAWGWTRA